MSREAAYYEPDELGTLAVTCWCGAEIVNVPVADIRAGRTVTCGRPDCKENQ